MATMDSTVPAGMRARSESEAARPVWTGSAPPLADAFIARPETGHLLQTALVPHATVALVSDRVNAGPRSWRDSCGKTQLAVAFAQAL